MNIDFDEVHDCFSIAEIMAYEDLEFNEKGPVVSLSKMGKTEPDGTMPVNLSGSFKPMGHPIGPTGTGKFVEVYKQLRGETGDRQISSPTRGLAHNVRGSVGQVTVHIFKEGWV